MLLAKSHDPPSRAVHKAACHHGFLSFGPTTHALANSRPRSPGLDAPIRLIAVGTDTAVLHHCYHSLVVQLLAPVVAVAVVAAAEVAVGVVAACDRYLNDYGFHVNIAHGNPFAAYDGLERSSAYSFQLVITTVGEGFLWVGSDPLSRSPAQKPETQKRRTTKQTLLKERSFAKNRSPQLQNSKP